MIGIDAAAAVLLHLAPADRTPSPSRSAPSAAVSFLKCVVNHESGGDPRSENPTSTASGLFSFIDGTWRHYAQHIPAARKYGHASSAPAAIQWQVALLAVKWRGHGNWSGTHCGYGT